MNLDKLNKAYNESRNGANFFVRHWCVRNFQYSDGVSEVCDAGAFWLLDIIATEVPQHVEYGDMEIIKVVAKGGKADVFLEPYEGNTPKWCKHIDTTDMPDGEWTFYLANEGERFALILPSEY